MFYKKRTTKKMWVTCHLIWFFTFIIWLPLMWLYYYFILIDVTNMTDHMIWVNMLVITGLFITLILIGIFAFIYSSIYAFKDKKFNTAYRFLWIFRSKKQQVQHDQTAVSLNPQYSKTFQAICIWQTIFYQLVFAVINIYMIVTTSISFSASEVLFNIIITLVWLISLSLNLAMIYYYRHSKFVHKS